MPARDADVLDDRGELYLTGQDAPAGEDLNQRLRRCRRIRIQARSSREIGGIAFNIITMSKAMKYASPPPGECALKASLAFVAA